MADKTYPLDGSGQLNLKMIDNGDGTYSIAAGAAKVFNIPLVEKTVITWDGDKQTEYIDVPIGNGADILITVINGNTQDVGLSISLEHEIEAGIFIDYKGVNGEKVKWTVGANGDSGVFGVIQGFPRFLGGRIVIAGGAKPKEDTTTIVQVQEG